MTALPHPQKRTYPPKFAKEGHPTNDSGAGGFQSGEGVNGEVLRQQNRSAAETIDAIVAPNTDDWFDDAICHQTIPESGCSLSDAESGGLIYIEQLSACPNSTICMLGKNEKGKAAVIFRPRCKLWSCPTCAHINKALWTMRTFKATEELIAAGLNLSMVTITAHENHTKDRAVVLFPDQWNKLQNRWRRRCIGQPYYAMFPEVGAEGHFHCHFLTDQWLTERFWKDHARRSGMGFEADEGDHNIPPAKAAGYSSKYLTKSFEFEWPKGFRRVRTSQNWPKLPPLEPDPNWTFAVLDRMVSLASVSSELRASGYRVALADHKTAWSVVNAC